jgi:hypothetical protein
VVRARSVTRRFYALRAFDEGVLFFPVYALYFADSGLTPAAISTLFILWSVAAFTLEIRPGPGRTPSPVAG